MFFKMVKTTNQILSDFHIENANKRKKTSRMWRFLDETSVKLICYVGSEMLIQASFL